MSIKYDLGPANRHAAVSLFRVRWLSSDMKELMRKEGIWEDLIQELYTAALDAYSLELNEEETRRYASRRLYAFLKAYGFHRRCRRNVRLEVPFTAAFRYNISDRGVAPGDKPPTYYFGSNHLDEKILAYIRGNPGGRTKSRIAASFEIPVKEVERYLVALKEKGLVIEVKRESVRGRPPGPLFLDANKPLPKPRMVTRGRDERIRHAYFSEGKSIKQIKRELHHDKRTIRRALGLQPAGTI